jgi:hypothetical protein
MASYAKPTSPYCQFRAAQTKNVHIGWFVVGVPLWLWDNADHAEI